MVQIFPGKFKFKIEKVYYLSCYLLFYRTFNFELKIRAFFSFRLWSLNISFFFYLMLTFTQCFLSSSWNSEEVSKNFLFLFSYLSSIVVSSASSFFWCIVKLCTCLFNTCNNKSNLRSRCSARSCPGLYYNKIIVTIAVYQRLEIAYDNRWSDRAIQL